MRVIALVAVACSIAAATFTLTRRTPSPPSPRTVAADYVKEQAATNGLRILGDKVWNVIATRDGVDLVVIRVKLQQPAQQSIFGVMPASVQTITLYVPVLDGALL